MGGKVAMLEVELEEEMLEVMQEPTLLYPVREIVHRPQENENRPFHRNSQKAEYLLNP